MKKSILLIGLALIILTSFSQITFEKTYGEEENSNKGFDVHQTFDGGYIIVGERQIDSIISDIYLIKTNENGDSLWTKFFGAEESLNCGYSIQQTIDSGFIIVGVTGDYYSNTSEILLIKTNQNGDQLWIKTYGGELGDVGFDIQQTQDSGYIISGGTKSYSEKAMVYLIKTNQNGDTLWTRMYGGDFDYYGGECVKQCEDGGYVISGAKSGDYYPTGFIIKTDPQGDSLWTSYKSYSLKSVDQTSDGGYITSGSSLVYGGPGAISINKFNSNGEFQWYNTMGGIGLWSFGRSIQQTIDGGYIVGGNLGSEACIIKTNNSGDSTWMYTFGTGVYNVINSISQTFDGGYIAAGTVDQNLIYLLKTDENGIITWTKGIYIQPNITLSIFPNPSKELVTVMYELEKKEGTTLTIQNLSGQEIKHIPLGVKKTGNYQLNCSDFSPGIYFVTLTTDLGILTKKLIIE